MNIMSRLWRMLSLGTNGLILGKLFRDNLSNLAKLMKAKS